MPRSLRGFYRFATNLFCAIGRLYDEAFYVTGLRDTCHRADVRDAICWADVADALRPRQGRVIAASSPRYGHSPTMCDRAEARLHGTSGCPGVEMSRATLQRAVARPAQLLFGHLRFGDAADLVTTVVIEQVGFGDLNAAVAQ